MVLTFGVDCGATVFLLWLATTNPPDLSLPQRVSQLSSGGSARAFATKKNTARLAASNMRKEKQVIVKYHKIFHAMDQMNRSRSSSIRSISW